MDVSAHSELASSLYGLNPCYSNSTVPACSKHTRPHTKLKTEPKHPEKETSHPYLVYSQPHNQKVMKHNEKV
jgi:hypothetical protein